MKLTNVFFILLSFFSFKEIISQDTPDLLGMTEDKSLKPSKEFVFATFKSTRLINFHTVEMEPKRSLCFRISHRFGNVNSGTYNAWGLDGPANIRLALEYSHDGRFMFGLGRTSIQKIVDGFLKYKLVRQSNQFPVTIALFSSMYYTFEKVNITVNVPGSTTGASQDVSKYSNPYDRMSFVNQIMVARKFNDWCSAQLTGAMVHYNLVDNMTEGNDCFVLGGLVRLKYNKRQSVCFEYGYRLNKYSSNKYYNSSGIGWEIETGGHVFQMFFTNSMGMTENKFLMYTDSDWTNNFNTWGVRLGFNISRSFSLARKI